MNSRHSYASRLSGYECLSQVLKSGLSLKDVGWGRTRLEKGIFPVIFLQIPRGPCTDRKNEARAGEMSWGAVQLSGG